MSMTELPDGPDCVPIGTQTRVPPDDAFEETEQHDDPDRKLILTQTRVPYDSKSCRWL